VRRLFLAGFDWSSSMIYTANWLPIKLKFELIESHKLRTKMKHYLGIGVTDKTLHIGLVFWEVKIWKK
jgi:tyrosyl-tRNA synthetase